MKTAVWDAVTGLPLKGAIVRAIGQTDGKIYGSAVVGESPEGEPFLIVPNIPAGETIRLQVKATGRTNGFQTYSIFSYTMSMGGRLSDAYEDYVSLPSNKDFQVVLDWHFADRYPEQEKVDLDLFVWLPGGARNPYTGFDGGLVASNKSGIGWNLFAINIPGTMNEYPFARAWRDGGGAYNPDKTEVDRTGSEVISIARKPGTSKPYFDGVGKGVDTRPDRAAYYNILIHADNNSILNIERSMIRIWYAGTIQAVWGMSDSCGPGETWRWVGSFYQEGNTMTYENRDLCGTTSLFPY